MAERPHEDHEEFDPSEKVGQMMRSFLAGDSLWSIARSAHLNSHEAMRLISSRLADDGELQRSRAVRSRCASAMNVLVRQMKLVTQLANSGIGTAKIPTVLAALGNAIDIDIAVEILNTPLESFVDPQTSLSGEELLAEKMSLLFVTGRSRGLKPNFELALAEMDLARMAALRSLIPEETPDKKRAEIMALIETTSRAIEAGHTSGISYGDYESLADSLAANFGNSGTKDSVWPVPAKDLRLRLGNGYWESALEAVGLTIRRAKDRFSRGDYIEAAKAYETDGHYFGSPKDVASYDGWVIAEAAAGRERPSVVDLRRHYGTWESVISAALPPEVDGELEGINEHFRNEHRIQEGWARAGELVTELLANMPWNSFLSVQYGDCENHPYAQASPSADGVWCEIVSEQFLGTSEWPIDADYLFRNGWTRPDHVCPNWYKAGVDLLEAGHQLLEGMRFGRSCRDPDKINWHTGSFPSGPGPDGRVTLDDALGGAVQSLKNAI